MSWTSRANAVKCLKTLRESDSEKERGDAFAHLMEHVCIDHLIKAAHFFADGKIEAAGKTYAEGVAELHLIDDVLNERTVEHDVFETLEKNPDIAAELFRRREAGEDVGLALLPDGKCEIIKAEAEPNTGFYM
jgi:hypothetical protein